MQSNNFHHAAALLFLAILNFFRTRKTNLCSDVCLQIQFPTHSIYKRINYNILFLPSGAAVQQQPFERGAANLNMNYKRNLTHQIARVNRSYFTHIHSIWLTSTAIFWSSGRIKISYIYEYTDQQYEANYVSQQSQVITFCKLHGDSTLHLLWPTAAVGLEILFHRSHFYCY